MSWKLWSCVNTFTAVTWKQWHVLCWLRLRLKGLVNLCTLYEINLRNNKHCIRFDIYICYDYSRCVTQNYIIFHTFRLSFAAQRNWRCAGAFCEGITRLRERLMWQPCLTSLYYRDQWRCSYCPVFCSPVVKKFVFHCGSVAVCSKDFNFGNCHFIWRQGRDCFYFPWNLVHRLCWIVSAGDSCALGESGVSGV